jgi:phosphoribosylformimino-5-aminoimidazole carboxamide ribotide isomerase
MLVIPSLDLEPDFSRTYAAAMADVIHNLEHTGFSRVQLTAGHDRNLPDDRLIEEMLRDVHCTTQIGGRFEATEEIDAALEAGADFVVLGTRALDEMDWLESVVSRFPGRLVLSSPARERRSRTRGAVRTLPLNLRDFAGEIAGLPLGALIVEFAADSDIGIPELALLEDVAEDVGFPVQVSGGTPDLATLRDLEFREISGAIVTAARLAADFDTETVARGFSD